MNTPVATPTTNEVAEEIRRRKRQHSMWYTALLTGVISAAYTPLAYWGFDGIILCIWVAAIGLALLHEFLAPAGLLIGVGIILSSYFEMPLSSMQRATLASPGSEMAPGDLVIPIAIIFAVGIIFAGAIAWVMTAMPQDVQRFVRSLNGSGEFTGLQAAQFSLYHLVGLMTVVCLAAAPIFYGGLAAGFSKSPLILLGGLLVIFKRYGLALGMLVILVFGYILF